MLVSFVLFLQAVIRSEEDNELEDRLTGLVAGLPFRGTGWRNVLKGTL